MATPIPSDELKSVPFDVSIIIPANNEEAYIGRCLEALLNQSTAAGSVQIIVSANCCTDRTADVVENLVARAENRDWELTCVSSETPGKTPALNRADRLAAAKLRVYLDADVVCEEEMLGQLRKVLARREATYATGKFTVAPARGWLAKKYLEFWTSLPFVKEGTVGAGLFAVNAAGRARWDEFPPVISDDTFVRLSFAPSERLDVPARFYWPIVEGLSNLVRVRQRQDYGVQQIYQLYPELRANDARAPLTLRNLMALAYRRPSGFAIYCLVRIIAKLMPATKAWSRGR